MQRATAFFTLASMFAVGLLVSCASQGSKRPIEINTTPAAAFSPPAARIDPPLMSDDAPRDYDGLHNVVAFHDGIYSGSVPEGDAGFDALVALGVRTVISVDGAEPDVVRARQRGLRYIHLPIGYNGFNDERKLELVRATRDAQRIGPVYLHCHHGKHRSAGAAGAVVASLGWRTADEAVSRMRVSGTAPGYRGLYAVAAEARVIPASVIDAVSADFPEVSRLEGFVKGMVEIDGAFEHLRDIEKAGWRTPPDHPDLVPVAEAGRLADLFRLLADGDYSQRKQEEFTQWMRDSARISSNLEVMLAEEPLEIGRLSRAFATLTAACKDCHVRYRD